MPFPLALIGTLLSLMGSVPKAIESVASVVETVTGDKPKAETPEEMVKHIETLPAEKAEAIVRLAVAKLEGQKLENERIHDDQNPDAETLKILPAAAAASVAMWRMTTRPKIAWRASYVLCAPIWLGAIDWFLMQVNGVARWKCWRPETTVMPDGGVVEQCLAVVDLFAEKILAPDSGFLPIYNDATDLAKWVIIVYMGGRTIEKLNDSGALEGLKGSIGRIAGGVKSLFGRGGK